MAEDTIKTIEGNMAHIMLDWEPYSKVVQEFHRLMKTMINVDGDEIIALVLVAAARVDALDGISPDPS